MRNRELGNWTKRKTIQNGIIQDTGRRLKRVREGREIQHKKSKTGGIHCKNKNEEVG